MGGNGVNTIVGALIATIIAVLTGTMALLTGEGVTAVGDISQIQWIILGVGGALTFSKDLQAIATRRVISRVTGSTDGGGEI